MYPIVSAASIDHSQRIPAELESEAIPGITELIGNSLRESVSQLQRREIQQISGSLDDMDDDLFQRTKLTLSQVAVMSIRIQSCRRLITRLPDLDEEQLRILITLAPKHLVSSVFEKLYQHQISQIAPLIPPENMEDLLSVAQASTILAILPLLSIEQLRSLLRSVSYDLCMTILPLLTSNQIQFTLPIISNEFRYQFLRTLQDLPDEVLTCQFPKIPPAHLAFAFAPEEPPERIMEFSCYLTREQIRFILPNLDLSSIFHLLEHAADEKRAILIELLSEQKTAEILAHIFDSIPMLQEHIRNLPVQTEDLNQQVITLSKYSDSLVGVVSERVWTNLMIRWTELQKESLQLIEQNRERARLLHTGLAILEPEHPLLSSMKQTDLIMQHFASELAKILRDISLLNQSFHLRIKQKRVTDTDIDINGHQDYE